MYNESNLTISLLKLSFDLFEQQITQFVDSSDVTEYNDSGIDMVTFLVVVDDHDDNALTNFLADQNIPYDISWDSYSDRHCTIPAGHASKRILPNGRSQSLVFDNSELSDKVPFLDVLEAYESGHIEQFLNDHLKSTHVISWPEQHEIIRCMCKSMDSLKNLEQAELDALVDEMNTKIALSQSNTSPLSDDELQSVESMATVINNSGSMIQSYFLISNGYIVEPIVVKLSPAAKATAPGFSLMDSMDKQVVKGYTNEGVNLSLSFEGYGDRYSVGSKKGTPLMVEYYHGELRVVIWSDINKVDPTHIVSLEGAKLEKLKG
ncbi:MULTISPECIES: hypothetical protein [Pseudoalteromonas]|uniref:hypothetical protein n=1 Tax=Pseudoalteromonas TaxID=53246 RepID=UPI0015843AD5|nr:MULTISPECIES: hypothetical protein [Pseudoalteromonas]MDI4654247.1 hypothetical protein [Pseudoalteromonas shioyasakiensis]NUJ40201.1 hypothetical protein [Pseudoalteromonas sp. 0303]